MIPQLTNWSWHLRFTRQLDGELMIGRWEVPGEVVVVRPIAGTEEDTITPDKNEQEQKDVWENVQGWRFHYTGAKL